MAAQADRAAEEIPRKKIEEGRAGRRPTMKARERWHGGLQQGGAIV